VVMPKAEDKLDTLILSQGISGRPQKASSVIFGLDWTLDVIGRPLISPRGKGCWEFLYTEVSVLTAYRQPKCKSKLIIINLAQLLVSRVIKS